MRQPKFKFGDKFTKKETIEYMGSKHTVDVVGYVSGIHMTYGKDYGEFNYEYKLTNQRGYFGSGRVSIADIREDNILKEWSYVTEF